MAAVITIEDGTGVANANSYVTFAEYVAYCEDRGLVAPDVEVATPLILEAALFLETSECKLQGHRTYPDRQALAWPRKCVKAFGVDVPDDVIPLKIKQAQMAAALASSTGLVLFPNQTGANITEETVGPLTTKFDATSWSGANVPVIGAVDILLKPYLVDCGQCGAGVRFIKG